MRFIADLHMHSRYSRATSRDMTPENLWKWSQLKGITVLGTGDFTHPQWLAEIKEKLGNCGNGLFRLEKKRRLNDVPASCSSEMYFMLTAEISCIYSKNGRMRKIHNIVLAPDFNTAEKINSRLSKIGNLSVDGRPILGLDAKELLSIVLETSEDAMLIPAHAWTPHFSVFGAASGFDSLEECFEELTPHVYAIETGLSSDPQMNWRLSSLDRLTLISNSDAHSPRKIGREANILDTDVSYTAITNAVKKKRGFIGTIEFFPEEGKYHYDGHRMCGVTLSPEETIRNNYLCPVCGKKVTIGVMHRIEKLADRKDGFKPEKAPVFYSVIPLAEIISETVKVGVNSKAVENKYFKLLENLGNEFKILMDCKTEEIESADSPQLAEAISRMRKGKVSIAPGFDGEYGKVKIFEEVERKKQKGQARLF
ncbi:MAG: DNA helicase UvrD [Nitrospirae bacterium CG_4_9_14_3_um_filter_44_28]|nr:MAG: DNA helicase UvrD [Nitrospirae bacterium CG_4_9_14_3_um_filter_44_28]